MTTLKIEIIRTLYDLITYKEALDYFLTFKLHHGNTFLLTSGISQAQTTTSTKKVESVNFLLKNFRRKNQGRRRKKNQKESTRKSECLIRFLWNNLNLQRNYCLTN
jgi:hypothetical protein